jgi:hypothetical protein
MDYSIAKERVRQMKKFYASLVIFILVFAFYNFREYYFNTEINIFHVGRISGIFWIWGGILAVKGVKIFFLNASWERKMMDKELNKNNNGNY